MSFSQSIYFCEGIDDDGELINENSQFIIPEDGGYLYISYVYYKQSLEVYMKLYSLKYFSNFNRLGRNTGLRALSCIIAFILFGCASQSVFYEVGVDSIIDPTMVQKKYYFIYPADSTISFEDLHFKEYSNYVKSALSQQGYKATDIDSAETIIFIRYGLGDPVRNEYTYSVPIFGRTDNGDATSTSRSTTYGNVGNTTVSGSTTTTTKVKSKPTYGVVGSSTHSETQTTYFRYLILNAFDIQKFKDSGTLSTLWETTITSVGSSDDLRELIPVMVAASTEYIGKNTKQRVNIEIKENDPRILNLKGISKKK